VVTLRGLYGKLRVTAQPPARPDAGIESKLTGSCAGCSFRRLCAKAPLRATSPKSQPPHLVLDSHYSYYNQNLSFDHLLSGVIAD